MRHLLHKINTYVHNELRLNYPPAGRQTEDDGP
jgi:hypothetical protein